MQPPTTIFGRPIRKFAHQADVLRLELLQQFGGVYLDLDVVLLRPLDVLLTSPQELVLAHEGISGSIGAGNALMLARSNASVLGEWYGRYHSFSDHVWNGFSVRLPMEFAIKSPERVRALDYTAFYWPPWNPWGIAQLYRSQRCLVRDQHAVHLWETKMWASLLGRLEPSQVASRATCFLRLANAVLDGSFAFDDATLDEGSAMDETVTVLYSADVQSQLDATPPLEKHLSAEPEPLPEALRPFLKGRAAPGCSDLAGAAECEAWAKAGECSKNADFMLTSCKRACALCP